MLPTLQAQRSNSPRRIFRGSHKFRLRKLTGICTYSPCIPRRPATGSMGLSGDLISRKPAVSPRKSASSSKPPRAPRGSRGLTKINRELLEDGTVALWIYANGQGRKNNHQVVFLTLTIPTRFQDGRPLEQVHINCILSQWPDLTKRLFEEVARLQVRLGIPPRFLYVIEPQEERWRREGKFYPHIHAVILNQWDKTAPAAKGFRLGAYRITPRDTDRIWGRLLSNLLGSPVDVSASGNLGTIKGLGGLYGYLTKLGRISRYCSKGSRLIPQIRDAGYELPRSWAGADQHTRREVKGSVSTMSAELTIPEMRVRLQAFSDEHLEQEGYPLFAGFWEVCVDGVDYPVALKLRIYRWIDIPLGVAVIEHITELGTVTQSTKL